MFIDYSSMFVLGYCVIHYHWNINYTRKISSFIVFFTALSLHDIFQYKLQVSPLISVVFIAILLTSLSHIGRQKFRFFKICFAAIDRPEDRPFTLYWLSTEIYATFIITILISKLYHYYGLYDYSYFMAFVVALGDGLAEPIGTRFGYHKYKTKAIMLSDKIYHRSLEGSLTVFFVCLCIIWYFSNSFTQSQLIYVSLLLPICITLAEAKSPHTWDGPFMHITGHFILLTSFLMR